MVFCVWVFFFCLLHEWHCAIASILLTIFLHLCALEIYPCSCVSVHIAVSNCCIEFHMNLLYFAYLPPWYITSVPFYTTILNLEKTSQYVSQDGISLCVYCMTSTAECISGTLQQFHHSRVQEAFLSPTPLIFINLMGIKRYLFLILTFNYSWIWTSYSLVATIHFYHSENCVFIFIPFFHNWEIFLIINLHKSFKQSKYLFHFTVSFLSLNYYFTLWYILLSRYL